MSRQGLSQQMGGAAFAGDLALGFRCDDALHEPSTAAPRPAEAVLTEVTHLAGPFHGHAIAHGPL